MLLLHLHVDAWKHFIFDHMGEIDATMSYLLDDILLLDDEDVHVVVVMTSMLPLSKDYFTDAHFKHDSC